MAEEGTKWKEGPWDSAMNPFYYSSYIQAINKSYQFYFQNVSQICPFLPNRTAHAIACPRPPLAWNTEATY